MNNNFDKNKLIDAAIKASGGKINRDAVSKGDASSIISALSADEQQKIKSILSDPKATKNLLDSDAARAIMDFLKNGGKGNG